MKNLFRLSVVYPKLNVNEATVLSYFSLLQSKSKTTKEDKLWFYCPVGEEYEEPSPHKKTRRPLASCFSWMCASSIHGTVTSLEKKGFLLIKRQATTANFFNRTNKRLYDKTLWYHVPEKVCEDMKRKVYWRYFDVEEARSFKGDVRGVSGIAYALVKNNIYRAFTLAQAEATSPFRLHLTGYAISRYHLPVLSPATCINCLNLMVEDGTLDKRKDIMFDKPTYSLKVPIPLEKVIKFNPKSGYEKPSHEVGLWGGECDDKRYVHKGYVLVPHTPTELVSSFDPVTSERIQRINLPVQQMLLEESPIYGKIS